jgi:NADH:ubiquinone oxidoreductase subunit 5 (subunit L)/multisubunit Na+/H+ antiporter MnhA subunit
MLKMHYGFDQFNHAVFVKGSQKLSQIFFHIGDEKMIDQSIVQGLTKVLTRLSNLFKRFQSGSLVQYSLVMITALVILLWFVIGGY